MESVHMKMLPLKRKTLAGCQWLMPVILAIWEAAIRRISV
jgi:hypothetical protein